MQPCRSTLLLLVLHVAAQISQTDREQVGDCWVKWKELTKGCLWKWMETGRPF